MLLQITIHTHIVEGNLEFKRCKQALPNSARVSPIVLSLQVVTLFPISHLTGLREVFSTTQRTCRGEDKRGGKCALLWVASLSGQFCRVLIIIVSGPEYVFRVLGLDFQVQAPVTACWDPETVKRAHLLYQTPKSF